MWKEIILGYGRENLSFRVVTFPLLKKFLDEKQAMFLIKIDEQKGSKQLTEQVGQMKPDMFSIIPKMLIPVRRQKVSSLVTSSTATICGVVISTAPITGASLWQEQRANFLTLLQRSNVRLLKRLTSHNFIIYT